jgi:transcription antitermination factor NusG
MGEACVNFNSTTGAIQNTNCISSTWFAVQTGYRCEQRVAQGLMTKGFETYLPLLREVHHWSDRKKIVDVPVFSGYLFVRCDPDVQNRVRVLETAGTLRLLGGNHAPSPVPEHEIEAVRRMLSSGLECDRCDSLTPGTIVRVVCGPLAGLNGRLVKVKSSVRLIVSVSLFSQAIFTELQLDDIEVVQPAARKDKVG